MGEHLVAAGERGKDYGAKGWGFLKSAYATVASQVENVARDNGYKVDLGALDPIFFAASSACLRTHHCRDRK